MKRRWFLASTAAVALATVSLTAACGGNESAEGGEAAGGVLTMATSADYPPYEFVETAGGTEEIVGFDVDIARHIATELGYDLEITNIDFNGLIPALQAGRADFVMAGMTPTEERQQNVDFSDIYYTAQQTIVSPSGSGITSPADLEDKTVGVQLGSIQEGLAQDLATETPGMELSPLNRINEIVQELKSGRIDAAIIEDTVAKGFLENNPDLEAVVIPEEGPVGSAIAFPKDSERVDDFNQVLAEMESSGLMEELIVKWFGDGAE
ncbi:transporter substrate-binding domain-containing protein [Nodosilinea sp. LEGE 07298]|uniref:transporter substrate-binding domain-containing protein n=1 Tax=Nodosilinea sp. LEGE 07298 TaxID=2777970 RepID=UPI001881F548|nr:transporter substrate-binding domain-containing protein [Nodosilinea sp. LEGE 07298]MBE9108333.1 transporter substrate-binding domain-containing protein [Nodosilinea sp. LEGE 07298]